MASTSATATASRRSSASVAELRQARKISPRLQLFGRADYLINRFAGIDYPSEKPSIDA